MGRFSLEPRSEYLSALEALLPEALGGAALDQSFIPRIARDEALMQQVEASIWSAPSTHRVINGDSRVPSRVAPASVHIVLTSPPYWTLKTYEQANGQLGDVHDYERFLGELNEVWRRCYEALVPGGRLVCVVGDVCLSRRKNKGTHTVVPLHAAIQEHCRSIGFANLAPIIWHKISNATHEARGGGSYLGKPYEPNSVIKNDIEFILMLRKPGGYRSQVPDVVRLLSVIPASAHKQWFQQVWTGISGASTMTDPAPYPVTLAERLIRMFSFVGDIVLDPFLGSGTTALAAAACGRSSLGIEVVPAYCDQAVARMRTALAERPSASVLSAETRWPALPRFAGQDAGAHCSFAPCLQQAL